MKVFLSHSVIDKPFVRQLARRFLQSGVQVWLDEAELNVGDSLIQRIAEGIEECDFIVAVISDASVKSKWVQKELYWAMTREIGGRRVVVLPVIVDHCVIPFFLRDKLYADFRTPDQFEPQSELLLRAVTGHSEQPLQSQSATASPVNVAISH